MKSTNPYKTPLVSVISGLKNNNYLDEHAVAPALQPAANPTFFLLCMTSMGKRSVWKLCNEASVEKLSTMTISTLILCFTLDYYSNNCQRLAESGLSR